jgi:hypothetical protein
MLQERRRQRLAAGDLARPVVPDAGVDDQLQPRCLDQQRVDTELQGVVLADEVRIEPRRLARFSAVACGMTLAGTGRSISTMRVILHPAHLPAQHRAYASSLKVRPDGR